MKEKFHQPVLLEEVIRYLNPKSNQNFIDCTLGDGGHTKAILEKTGPNGKVLGIDLDKGTIKRANKRLSKFKDRLILAHNNFFNIKQVAYDNRFTKISGILFDLGFSWGELSDKERGFSFLNEGPLDMRFDKNSHLTAHQIVNTYSEKELEKIFKNYGEEKFAKRIARGITKKKKLQNIQTTFDLLDIIKQAVPKNYLYKKINPATKTFQALRIEVNDELNNLKKVLPEAMDLLEKGGKIAVISFHSLEDRIVKHYFKQLSKGCICPPDFPKCVCGRKPEVKLITKKVIRPSADEIKINPLSRSAKFRVAEKL